MLKLATTEIILKDMFQLEFPLSEFINQDNFDGKKETSGGTFL